MLTFVLTFVPTFVLTLALASSVKPGLSHYTQEVLFISRPDKHLIASSIGNYVKLHGLNEFNSPIQAKTDANLIPSKIIRVTGKVLAPLLK